MVETLDSDRGRRRMGRIAGWEKLKCGEREREEDEHVQLGIYD